MRRPAVVVSSQEILDESASVVQVVPLTTSIRSFGSEVFVSADQTNGLSADSAAQCQHIRSVSAERVEQVLGNIGPVALADIREVLGLILDIRIR
ncbi:MAG: type II toxin-antitoxin system PemK/MazF family toxin [Acidimicrobiia bacterium]